MWISEGATGMSAAPGVLRAVDKPTLRHRNILLVVVDGAFVKLSSWRASGILLDIFSRCRRMGRANNAGCVGRMHGLISSTLENDHAHTRIYPFAGPLLFFE